MIYIEKNKLTIDTFVVKDENDNSVLGLIQNNFIIKLYNPSKIEVANISGGITVDIEEVGDGIYRVMFIPNEFGIWELVIYNSTYFPFGKGENYECLIAVNGVSIEADAMIRRILGLSQENYRIWNPQYDKNNNMIGGIIKIYKTSEDIETDTDAIASYQIESIYNLRTNLMTSYKVKKI